jgi:hypothetical protein
MGTVRGDAAVAAGDWPLAVRSYALALEIEAAMLAMGGGKVLVLLPQGWPERVASAVASARAALAAEEAEAAAARGAALTVEQRRARLAELSGA